MAPLLLNVKRICSVNKKHKKKLKRAARKKKEKALAQENNNKLKKQMNMFDRLPNKCSTCDKEFPKTREAHMTWRVVVKTDKEKVWLFCPGCQQQAKQMVEGEKDEQS
jgi:hypothetical protein